MDRRSAPGSLDPPVKPRLASCQKRREVCVSRQSPLRGKKTLKSQLAKSETTSTPKIHFGGVLLSSIPEGFEQHERCWFQRRRAFRKSFVSCCTEVLFKCYFAQKVAIFPLKVLKFEPGSTKRGEVVQTRQGTYFGSDLCWFQVFQILEQNITREIKSYKSGSTCFLGGMLILS